MCVIRKTPCAIGLTCNYNFMSCRNVDFKTRINLPSPLFPEVRPKQKEKKENVTDTDDNSDLEADVDSDTLIRIVRSELKNGKAPGMNNVYNDILKKAISTGFYKLFDRAFSISLKPGFIPYVWKVAVLCMLIKPDKPSSQTTSYRPISLLSAVMKRFEPVIEKRLQKHLEDNGFF